MLFTCVLIIAIYNCNCNESVAFCAFTFKIDVCAAWFGLVGFQIFVCNCISVQSECLRPGNVIQRPFDGRSFVCFAQFECHNKSLITNSLYNILKPLKICRHPTIKCVHACLWSVSMSICLCLFKCGWICFFSFRISTQMFSLQVAYCDLFYNEKRADRIRFYEQRISYYLQINVSIIFHIFVLCVSWIGMRYLRLDIFAQFYIDIDIMCPSHPYFWAPIFAHTYTCDSSTPFGFEYASRLNMWFVNLMKWMEKSTLFAWLSVAFFRTHTLPSIDQLKCCLICGKKTLIWIWLIAISLSHCFIINRLSRNKPNSNQTKPNRTELK